jgi:hypothetical protein
MVSLAVEREVHVLLKKAAVFNRSSCKVASSSKFLTFVASWKKNPMFTRLQSPILFLVSNSIGFHFRSREESRWGMWGCLWEKAGWGSTGGRRAAAGPSSLHDLEHTHEIFFSQKLLLGSSIMMLLRVKQSQKKWVLPSLRETRYLMALSLLTCPFWLRSMTGASY